MIANSEINRDSDEKDARKVAKLFVAPSVETSDVLVKKEIVDDGGALICTLEYETETQGSLVKVKKLRLINGEKELDLIEFARLGNFRDLFLGDRNTSYAQDIVVKSLETLLDIGVLLHEMGHQKQNDDAQMRRLKDIHYSNVIVGIEGQLLRSDPFLLECDSVFDRFPETRDYFLADANFREYYECVLTDENSGKDLSVLEGRIRRMRKKIDSMSAREKIVKFNLCRRLRQKIADLAEKSEVRKQAGLDAYDKSVALSRDNPMGNELIRLPIQYIEWDANRRALQWLHEIEAESGIDLRKATLDEDGQSITIKEHLEKCLDGFYGHPKCPVDFVEV